MYEGVVANMRGGEGFSCEVSDPITDLVVTSCDEAALLIVQGMTYRKFGVSAIKVGRKVWGIYAVS